MQLDRISARIAPRSAWQAMDLGTHLYQAWWKPLTLIWLAFSLPVLAIAVLLTWYDNSFLALALLWWLKPALERPLLEFCARTLFGQHTPLATLLREWPRYGVHGLLPWLLWRRVYFTRSFSMPVVQLERQRGAAYRERLRVLNTGATTHASTLTALMVHVEQIFAYCLVILMMMLMPSQLGISEVDWLTFDENIWLALLCWYAVLCVTQPLYVACGFALYLNKRTWLEGWDLELGLRAIGKRRQGQPVTHLAVCALCLFALSAALPITPAGARVNPDTDISAARADAIDIVAQDAFMPFSSGSHWQWRDHSSTMDSEEQAPDWLQRLLEWLFDRKPTDRESGALSLADMLSFILWCTAISLLLWLLWHYRDWLRRLPAQLLRQSVPMTHIGGLDIRPESLPEDIPARILLAVDQGELREAVSLLYRATLSRLAQHSHFALPPGATESEALTAFRHYHHDKTGVAMLAEVTPLWISTAWAHRAPDSDQLRRLVVQWQTHFAAAPAELSP
jgi:hypothetical protein